jgi:hypothetical protein
MARHEQAPERDAADDAVTVPNPEKVGGRISVAAWLLALGWLGAVGAFAYGALGLEALQKLQTPLLTGGALMAVMPALLILFAASAAREGAKSRAQARALSIAAERMLAPAPGAEAAARRLGVAVRGEIAALDRALDQTLQKLRDVETVIARQTLAVDHAAGAAQAGARHMISGLERERAELLQIADDLNNQAGLIGEAIGRHTRLISDAARLAEAEVRAADEALDTRLSSFGAAAALIADRTQALTSASQATADSALRLETALSSALDALAEATSLTDTARKSAEAATFAASNTAGALRDTTARAIDDAKRAADTIRAEAASVEREGVKALERLRETAQSARGDFRGLKSDPGAAPAPAYPEEPPAPRRAAEPVRPADAGFAETLNARTPQPAPRAPAPASESSRWTWREVLAAIDEEPAVARTPATARLPEPRPPEPRSAEQPPVARFSDPRPTAPAQPQEPSHSASTRTRFFDQRLTDARARGGGGFGFGGGGREPPRATDPEPRLPEARRAAPPADPPPPIHRDADAAGRWTSARQPEASTDAARAAVSRDAQARGFSERGFGERGHFEQPQERARLVQTSPALALLDQAGLRVGELFPAAAIERIAQKAKNGTQARRRAVREAAADAVLRLAEHLDANAQARADAGAFLKSEGARIAEQLGRGKAALDSETVRAFLLIDAAAA